MSLTGNAACWCAYACSHTWLGRYVIDRPLVKPVQCDAGSADSRLLLLSEACQSGQCLASLLPWCQQYAMRMQSCELTLTPPGLSDLPEELARQLVQGGAELTPYTLQLGYEHCTGHQALKVSPAWCAAASGHDPTRDICSAVQRLLPPDTEVPTAFETVGHIAHLNLKEEHLPYKHVIGQVPCSCRA